MSYSASDFVNDIEQGMTDHKIPEVDRAAWCEMADESPDEEDEEQNMRILAERACCAFNSLNEIVGGYVVLRAALSRALHLVMVTPRKNVDASTWQEWAQLARAALGGTK